MQLSSLSNFRPAVYAWDSELREACQASLRRLADRRVALRVATYKARIPERFFPECWQCWPSDSVEEVAVCKICYDRTFPSSTGCFPCVKADVQQTTQQDRHRCPNGQLRSSVMCTAALQARHFSVKSVLRFSQPVTFRHLDSLSYASLEQRVGIPRNFLRTFGRTQPEQLKSWNYNNNVYLKLARFTPRGLRLTWILPVHHVWSGTTHSVALVLSVWSKAETRFEAQKGHTEMCRRTYIIKIFYIFWYFELEGM